MVTHTSMMWNAFNILTATQIAAPGVHMLNPMPLFHAGGLNMLANPILMHGGRVTTMAAGIHRRSWPTSATPPTGSPT